MSQTYYFSAILRILEPTDHKAEVVQIRADFDKIGCNDYIFQLEQGEQGGWHYQCYLHTEKKYRAKTLWKRLDPKLGNDPSRQAWGVKACSDAGKEAIKSYCIKTDHTKRFGPWTKKNVYIGADLRCMEQPLPWQKEVIISIQENPDDRIIHWVYNEDGNAGKSKLMKWCKFNKLSVRIPLGNAQQIKTSAIQKGASTCYMLDLPRVRGKDEKIAEVMSSIEELKNGWVESCMYGKNQELMMQPPHVWVFSNELPYIQSASRDRWRIYNLLDRNSPLVLMTDEDIRIEREV